MLTYEYAIARPFMMSYYVIDILMLTISMRSSCVPPPSIAVSLSCYLLDAKLSDLLAVLLHFRINAFHYDACIYFIPLSLSFLSMQLFVIR